MNTYWRYGLVCSLVGLAACPAGEGEQNTTGLSAGDGTGIPNDTLGGETSGVSAGATDDDGGVEGTGTGNGSGAVDETGGVACDEATPCPLGEVCSGGMCVLGCDDTSCGDGLACCDGACVDVQTEVAHCGQCDNDCGTDSCVEGQCVSASCQPGSHDCNGDPSDGCESPVECSCMPGATEACYTGPAGTQDVGVCTAGTRTCNEFGTAWLPCSGQVLPAVEACGNALDDDCDATVDEDDDVDGDGFGVCSGDCCDAQGAGCLSPELVNPGAFEVDGNELDDDCDGAIDNAVTTCDAGLASNSGNALDYARAIDLCRVTTENPASPQEQTWGLISASLTLANGNGAPAANSRSIRNGFGNNIANRFGERLAVLSTGHAADDAGDVNPPFANFQSGQSMGTTSPAPADWLAANGDAFPNSPGCPISGNTTANNPVMLTVRVRVPTNAQSFSVDMFFFSAEYPEYVCTAFNDFFVTLVDSESVTNPADKNIAIYSDGDAAWPVGVNILSSADGLFTACNNGTISQCGGDPMSYDGCTGNALLSGTGFDRTANACGFNGFAGGGTGWLTMSGNVQPGEIMQLRFAIWDTGDQAWDSLVLLDNWQWSVQASEPGIEPT